jgi:vancomycin permeability regulator SanA
MNLMKRLLDFLLSAVGKIIIFIVVLILFIMLPNLLLLMHFSKSMYSDVHSLPVKEYGVLFGARVYGENRLTDAAKERADAAVLLYKENKIKKVFVSGDNENDQEAENLAKHLIANGVPSESIVIDKQGLDTLDTCNHLQDNKITEATLITQSFHLPRAMLFCENKVRSLAGIKANYLGLLENRGSDTFQIYYIRTIRFFREAILNWSYVLGIYDKYSDEAERSRVIQ